MSTFHQIHSVGVPEGLSRSFYWPSQPPVQDGSRRVSVRVELLLDVPEDHDDDRVLFDVEEAARWISVEEALLVRDALAIRAQAVRS